MDLGSFFLLLALLILVGLFISRPFFEQKKAVLTYEVDSLDHQRSTLLAERDRILNALQELDFDHAMGKIPEDEYPVQRALLVQSGAQVLRQLDTLQLGAAGDDVDVRLEAAIEARRAEAAQGETDSSDPASKDAPALRP